MWMGSLLPGVSLPSLQQKKKISIANPKIRNMNKELLYFLSNEEFSIENETWLAYCSLSIMHQLKWEFNRFSDTVSSGDHFPLFFSLFWPPASLRIQETF